MSVETSVQAEDSVTQTRNSRLRIQTAWLVNSIASGLHRKLRWLTPNMVTALGVGMVAAGTCHAEEQNLQSSDHPILDRTIQFGLLATGYACDAIDGALARTINKETPGKHDSSRGQLVDVAADRVQEVLAALLRARTARLRGNKIGEYLAYSTALTTTLPSLVRAVCETKGKTVPEAGSSLFETAGSRPGRIALNTVSSFLNRIHGVPISPAIDCLATLANLNTTRKRAEVIFNAQVKPCLSGTKRKEAVARFKLLAGITALSLGATIATHRYLHNPKN